jgi:hypothetical protein
MKSPSKHQTNKQKEKSSHVKKPEFKKIATVIRDTQCSTKKIKIHMQRQK